MDASLHPPFPPAAILALLPHPTLAVQSRQGAALSRQELQAAHCREADDQVPRRPGMTEFRRRLRYHQARWREANGHPIGSQYLEVTQRSGVFGPGAIDAVNGTDLLVMWLEHLLLLSMLQHPSGTWRWGRYVVVHPAGNTDVADACARYRALLVDQATFSSVTVEELLDANVLPARTTAALRDRYLPGGQPPSREARAAP
jgi:hypothetical protein